MSILLRTLIRGPVIAALLLASGLAQSATLTFVTPNGTVGPNDPVEVWVRLSTTTNIAFNGNSSDPNSYQSLFPTPPPFLPQWPDFFGQFVASANGGAGAFVTFDVITDAITNNSRACTGTFNDIPPCSSSNYTFSFDFFPNPNAFAFRDTFTLLAGQSRDFLLGTFAPKPGGAAPGAYTFAGVSFFYLFTGYGTDDFGVSHFMSNVKVGPNLASICSSISDPTCTFTRQVVPVPAAAWLLGGALGLLGLVRRRSVYRNESLPEHSLPG